MSLNKTFATALILSASLAAQSHAKLAHQAKGETIVDVAVRAGGFKTLVAAVQAAGLEKALRSDGPFTVFAPTDAAFAALPKGALQSLLKPENKGKLAEILKYHVVSGKAMAADVVKMKQARMLNGHTMPVVVDDAGVRLGEAKVLKTDIMASNGVIHVIDRVLMPKPDLIDTAIAAGKFKTLVTAVQAAGLVEALRGDGPFTVFAPTDAAFAKIGADTLQSLLKPENKSKLQSILKYHVVGAKITAAQAMKADSAKTLQGGSLAIVRKGRDLTVGGAKVIGADVMAGNGIIHVIDSVLLPPAGH